MSISGVNNNSAIPSFGRIKSIKCIGLYKKHPDLQLELIDTFSKNPVVADFCNEYDVDVVFYAKKDMQDSVDSSVHIFYDNVTDSKLKKFFRKLNNNYDKIEIGSYGNCYELDRSLKAATNTLKKYMMPEESGVDGCGMLSSHVKLADQAMQEVLNKRKEEALLKKTIESAKAKSQTKNEQDQAKVDELVRKLTQK